LAGLMWEEILEWKTQLKGNKNFVLPKKGRPSRGDCSKGGWGCGRNRLQKKKASIEGKNARQGGESDDKEKKRKGPRGRTQPGEHNSPSNSKEEQRRLERKNSLRQAPKRIGEGGSRVAKQRNTVTKAGGGPRMAEKKGSGTNIPHINKSLSQGRQRF